MAHLGGFCITLEGADEIRRFCLLGQIDAEIVGSEEIALFGRCLQQFMALTGSFPVPRPYR